MQKLRRYVLCLVFSFAWIGAVAHPIQAALANSDEQRLIEKIKDAVWRNGTLLTSWTM